MSDYIKFLKGNLAQLPETVTDGNIYFAKNSSGLYFDIGTTRYHINPQSDWNETTTSSLSYIQNKPEIGTVASRDVAEAIDLSTNIPTSVQVYNAIDTLTDEIESVKSLVNGPYVATAQASMIDTDKIYVYIGSEEGMTSGNWYYYDTTLGSWTSGGIYNAVRLNTDKTLSALNEAADAQIVGNRLLELQTLVEDLYVTTNNLSDSVDTLTTEAESYTNALYVTDAGLVYLMHDDNIISDAYGPFAGGGGGGGGSYDSIDAEFSANNTTDWTSKSISNSGSAEFSFYWESLENNEASGQGTVTITVNTIVKATLSVSQGNVVIPLQDYCNSGANKIRIRIADQYDQGKSWIVNVEVVSLSIESLFDSSFPFTDAFLFTYTPFGNISKTVHFLVDGTEIGTVTTSVTARQLSYTIPAQTHGDHTLDVYFTAIVNGEEVSSNTLHYSFMFVSDENADVIISTSFTDTTQQQYASVAIPYKVYDANALESTVEIYVNDVLTSTQTVDRSQQTFTYKAKEPGTFVVKFVSGETEKSITLTVVASGVSIEPETEALVLYLTSEGRSNGESLASRTTWTYNDISATFSDFDWITNGWVTDDDGIPVLRVRGGASVTIPYRIFASDFKTTGKTIEFEFETRDVVNYNTPIISCKSDGIGIEITPQQATFSGAQTSLMTLYKENEHVRLSIVIEKQNEYRVIYFYINGVMSAAKQYASGERFSQTTPVDITIGSEYCGIDIYNVRVYDNNLTRQQIVTNWIADTQDGELMLQRHERNNIYDDYGDVQPSTIPDYLPYMIFYAPELPQYKGDKKTIYGEFTDPQDSSKSFSFQGCQINVQGTSSQGYFRKNYDMQFKKGFEMSTGHADEYTIINAVPFNRFVLKADVASSESANNTKLVMFYNETCPYKTPEMLADSRVRWGIEGRPAALPS